MGKVYVGQTALTITLTTGEDATDATCKIKYKKPNGDTGAWDATIVTAATGVIRYSVASSTIIDQAGEWTVWAYITFNDATVAAGEPLKFTVYNEGE